MLLANKQNRCLHSSVYSKNITVDRKFTEECKLIFRATRNIKNPITRRKILEYFFTILLARYAEEKVSNLVDKSLERILNSKFLYGRESKKSTQ